MTAPRDPDRLIHAFLLEGAEQLHDQVYDAVRADIERKRQRVVIGPWRMPTMNKLVPLGVGIAAVAVAAVLGTQLLAAPAPGGVGAVPSVQPSPTPSPSATPQPTEIPRLPASGQIEPGTYRMGTEPGFLVTVPAGWVSNGGMSLRKHLDQPNEVALDMYSANIRIFADACKSEGTEQPIGPTAQDLVAALEAQKNSEVSDPVEVTVAGLPGIRLEISAPAGLDVAQCSIGSLQIWVDQGGEGGYLAGVGLDDTPSSSVYVVDTPGGRLAFRPYSQGDATPADIAERDAIIESMSFEP